MPLCRYQKLSLAKNWQMYWNFRTEKDSLTVVVVAMPAAEEVSKSKNISKFTFCFYFLSIGHFHGVNFCHVTEHRYGNLQTVTMTVNSTVSTWCYDTANWLTARGTCCTVHSEQGVDMGQ